MNKIALTIKKFDCSGEIEWIAARSTFERYIVFSIDTLLVQISPCRFYRSIAYLKNMCWFQE